MQFLSFLLAQSAGAGAGAPGGGGPSLLIMMVLMFVIMYFITIRPQRQRQKKLEEQIGTMRPGDRLITTGGLHATLNSLKERTALVKIAEGVKVEIERSAIAVVQSNRDEAPPPAPVSDVSAS